MAQPVITERIMERVALAVDIGISKDEIVKMLATSDVTGYAAFLAYHAGRQLSESRGAES